LTAEGSPEFLPTPVLAYPDDTAFAAALTSGQQPERLDRSRLPAGAAAQDVAERPADSTWLISSPTAGSAVYQSFYFPGWIATIDGHTAPIQITAPQGLMEIAVPAGQHRVRFEFVATPVRAVTAVISLAALAGLLGLALMAARAKSQRPDEPPLAAPQAAARVWPAAIMVLAGLALLVAIKWVYLDRAANPLAGERLTPAGLVGVSHAAHIDFGDQLENLGYDLDHSAVPSGGELTLTQYWTALVDIGVPYGMEVRLTDDAGHVWSAPSARPFGYVDYPGTESWPLGAYTRDAYQISTLPGTPPGHYWLETSAFRRDVAQSLVPAAGTATGPDPAWARLGQVQVLPSTQSAANVQSSVGTFQPVEAGQGLRLLGWTTPGGSLSPGDPIDIQLLWQNQAAQTQALTGTLLLSAPNGSSAGVFPFELGGPNYPAIAWAAGSLVRDQVNSRLPTTLGSGNYGLQLSVGAGKTLALGTLALNAPDRQFTPPSVAVAAPTQMGFARLLGLSHGIDPATPGQTIHVELVWQSTADTATSYRVYVHLRDGAGNIHAQSDSAPSNWSRPTTGWLPGEYVLDPHELQLNASLATGAYSLFAGLYDPATGQRLGEARLGTVEVK
jgi:hypothetical protein